ncbi:winged helix-turn-helix domain-containing protein [Thermodesulfobacteriota bacterium]
MGSGPLRLLENIRKNKSINKAARSMNLSYVKALKILNRLEKGLDRKMLIRERGGNMRGGTQLTCYAEKYIELFIMLEERINRFAQSEFQKFQKDLEKDKENEHS